MLSKSNINWTDWIWPIVEGCTPVSPGCRDCWASEFVGTRLAVQSERFRGLTVLRDDRHVFNGTVRFQQQLLDAPLRHRKPGRVFVASRSDLFHDGVTDEQIAAVFGVMAAAPHLTFQVLTKRPERAARWFETMDKHVAEILAILPPVSIYPRDHWYSAQAVGAAENVLERQIMEDLEAPIHAPWPLPNVHLGTTVEDQKRADERIPHLLACPAAVRWLSVEPMLEAIDLGRYYFSTVALPSSTGPRPYPFPMLAEEHRTKWIDLIDWVVVGGESGRRARPFALEWADDVRRQCAVAGVPFFMKQAGSHVYLENANLWPDPWVLEAMRRQRHVPDGVTAVAAVGLRLRHPHGADLAELPEALRVREWPRVAER